MVLGDSAVSVAPAADLCGRWFRKEMNKNSWKEVIAAVGAAPPTLITAEHCSDVVDDCLMNTDCATADYCCGAQSAFGKIQARPIHSTHVEWAPFTELM